MADFSNRDDVIDSRNIIERIEELSNERDGLVSDAEEAPAGTEDAERAVQALAAFDESDDGQELKTLLALQEQADGSPDWPYGETLIRDTYFKDYARDFAEDIHGGEMRSATWPFTCIDWDMAARELKYDYFEVDFGGITYWIRN